MDFRRLHKVLCFWGGSVHPKNLAQKGLKRGDICCGFLGRRDRVLNLRGRCVAVLSCRYTADRNERSGLDIKETGGLAVIGGTLEGSILPTIKVPRARLKRRLEAVVNRTVIPVSDVDDIQVRRLLWAGIVFWAKGAR